MITDEMLKKAAEEAVILLNASLPEPRQCNHQFSSKFENKMKRLIRKTEYPVFSNVLKSVACVLLIIIIGTVSILTVSVDARAAVLGWIKQQYENFYEYFFEGEIVGDVESSKYVLNWIPESYSFATSFETANGETYIYNNEQGMILQFSYSYGEDGMAVFAENNGYDKSEIMINDLSAELYITTEEMQTSGIVWEDISKKILFRISAYVSKEDLIKMAENVGIKKPK